MNHRPTILALVAAAAVCGCNNNAGYTPEPPKEVQKTTVAAGDEASLWPLAVGNQWVFEATTTTANGTTVKDLTFKVTDNRKEGDKTIARIDILDGSKVVDSIDWAVDKTGIYQVTSTNQQAKYDPPQLIVKFPIKDGETFSQQLNGPAPTTGKDVVGQKVESTCLGMQEIDTGEGRMQAVAVESKTVFTYKDDTINTVATIWFVPKVGMARFIQETVGKKVAGKEIFRMKSHTAK
ncbi:MAG: hypothetical protein JSS65_03790 [Armatimonadetes bacterium]|nr:hypothetical protein [Armatimonadota bacterium]